MNAVILWNTIYLDRALQFIRDKGQGVNPEDEARLSPLQHEHINVLGRHHFKLPEAVKNGKFRQLRIVEDIKISMLPEMLAEAGLSP